MGLRHQRYGAVAALLLVGACAADGAVRKPDSGKPTTVASCASDWTSPMSLPGREWWAENRWRFRTDEEASAAYGRLGTDDPSPWPDWFEPRETVLQPGVRFQMALSPGQAESSPGAFGTFDNVRRVDDVRSSLAVRQAWKREVDRVVTYEVIRPVPVKVGPIGPQVDGELCRLLPGRWSQLQMLLPPAERIRHLLVVEVRKIR